MNYKRKISKGKIGLINSDDVVVIPVQYDEVDRIHQSNYVYADSGLKSSLMTLDHKEILPLTRITNEKGITIKRLFSYDGNDYWIYRTETIADKMILYCKMDTQLNLERLPLLKIQLMENSLTFSTVHEEMLSLVF